ncbi:hypothetical protein [Streptomyces sp. MNU89]|uniref:hypothetical protein n=1 Tax=Streptomyces sp. MNU89 TaxID=2560025 RepID=UPI001E3DFDA6|nr:hypothetical protein [Streptomyces sp. MNU89]MCC9742563.1 hypothetical protein [Streptomyces sp. MNU89]
MTAPSGRPRADLLALTHDTLAALTNRGLVKRASKDIDAGRAPVLTVSEDGRVRADYAGAAVAELPPGAGLDNGSCGCGATGVCRHLIGLVLAYQRTASAHGTTGTPAVPVAPAAPATTTAPITPAPPGGVTPSATGSATTVRPRAAMPTAEPPRPPRLPAPPAPRPLRTAHLHPPCRPLPPRRTHRPAGHRALSTTRR